MKLRFDNEKFTNVVKEKMFTQMAKEKRRIGVREFAKKIGVSASTISRVENGKLPDVETFYKICWWMNKSTDEFFKR